MADDPDALPDAEEWGDPDLAPDPGGVARRWGAGLAVGAAVGVALGVALDDVILGLSIGVAVGVVVGAAWAVQ